MNRKTRSILPICAAVIGMVLACSAPGGCDVCRVPATAIANVFVRGTAAVPLGGVDIHALANSDTCGGPFLAGEGPLRADPEGHPGVSMATLAVANRLYASVPA